MIDFVSAMTEPEVVLRYDLIMGRVAPRLYEKLAKAAHRMGIRSHEG